MTVRMTEHLTAFEEQETARQRTFAVAPRTQGLSGTESEQKGGSTSEGRPFKATSAEKIGMLDFRLMWARLLPGRQSGT
jgi:hypothetical protein